MLPKQISIRSILTSKPVLAAEVIVLLFFAFNVTKEILKKRAIEREIKRMEADIGRLQNDKDKLYALLSYVKTPAFVEQEAREKLNLGKAGENLLLVPKIDEQVASTTTASNEESQASTESIENNNQNPQAEPNSASPASSSNPELWMRYFFEHERLWEK